MQAQEDVSACITHTYGTMPPRSLRRCNIDLIGGEPQDHEFLPIPVARMRVTHALRLIPNGKSVSIRGFGATFVYRTESLLKRTVPDGLVTIPVTAGPWSLRLDLTQYSSAGAAPPIVYPSVSAIQPQHIVPETLSLKQSDGNPLFVPVIARPNREGVVQGKLLNLRLTNDSAGAPDMRLDLYFLGDGVIQVRNWRWGDEACLSATTRPAEGPHCMIIADIDFGRVSQTVSGFYSMPWPHYLTLPEYRVNPSVFVTCSSDGVCRADVRIRRAALGSVESPIHVYSGNRFIITSGGFSGTAYRRAAEGPLDVSGKVTGAGAIELHWSGDIPEGTVTLVRNSPKLSEGFYPCLQRGRNSHGEEGRHAPREWSSRKNQLRADVGQSALICGVSSKWPQQLTGTPFSRNLTVRVFGPERRRDQDDGPPPVPVR